MNDQHRRTNPDVNSFENDETAAGTVEQNGQDDGRINIEVPSPPDQQPGLPAANETGVEEAPKSKDAGEITKMI